MSGLAHYLERAGIPTVVISLVREHTERMRPPRALAVPFQFGRPFGAPNAAAFQRRVLCAALDLLARCDGPVLEDFPDMPPGESADADGSGWACPIALPATPAAAGGTARLRERIAQELALLRPWYEESIRASGGRRLDGLTPLEPATIAARLIDYLDDPATPSFVPGEPIARAIKLGADDLKHFYFQAALARPGGASGLALDRWFFGETAAGALHFALRRLLLGMADPALRRVGEISLVPHAAVHLDPG